MTLYIHILEETDEIIVRVPMVDVDVIGTFIRRVKPGEGCLKWTYDELKAMGNGGHEINFDDDAQDQRADDDHDQRADPNRWPPD
jgi:hypothetical protein